MNTEAAACRRPPRMSQPALHHRRIAGSVASMTHAIGATLDRWRENPRWRTEPLDVPAEFTAPTLAIAGRALLGIDLLVQEERIGRAVPTSLGDR